MKDKKIKVADNSMVYFNDEEDFEKAGYKTLEIEEEPAFNMETQYLEPYYQEQKENTIQKWKIKEIEEVG
jgi:hypothetical protein